ncbi:MAG TPA: glycosyl hydrolase family 18 protein [Bacteroidia bacterium]|nr:glycosyl hydrolase family 18 protein [Bacteroidia bacterium]
MKKLILLPALLFSCTAFSQNSSVVQEQSAHYGAMGPHDDAYWDQVRQSEGEIISSAPQVQNVSTCTLNKRVFGWHPYWNGSTYTNYQWNLLSDFCYFDFTVSPNTGHNTNASYAWSTSAAVTAAISNGVNAHICATLFSSHSTFLGSATAMQNFISDIISDLQARGGKGVNIDFEGMTASNSAPFTAFIQNLSTQLHAAIPGSEVSIALYAVDWSAVFDIPNLSPYVDLFIIMGYDYYWSGSTTAGPEDPLYDFETSYNYTLTRSITYYLKQGMPASKLLLGLPYYGREWETTGSSAPSATTGAYTATKTFSTVMANTNGYYSSPQWEPNSFSVYYPYQVSANWRQCFCDNDFSMRKRFDIVNQRNIGGIGIWALGYDDGYMDFWNAIQDKFTNCATVPCSDTLYDMGGPNRNYYDAENYTTTIAPTGASAVSLSFSQFDVELNYDTLWIYNGATTASPLIGAYTGTNSPGTVTSTGPALTIRFKSDNATTRPGFTAVWQCMMDNTPPATQVTTTGNWQTQNFPATFADTDNQGGSGIEKSFYQVCDYNGNDWRANNADGFFNDDFSQPVISSDWTTMVGTWAVNSSGQLEQSDESQSNTNIYAPLTQNLSNRYVYCWDGAISGTGNNRRAGFHFFCDDATQTNRGNSYFVWFRVDQGTLEFYKVVNNVFTLEQSYPMTVNAGQWYNWKVIYDRITGVIEVYQDDVFAGSWTDPAPYSSGNAVSFRSGNCNWKVDNFHVFRSRYSNAQTTVSVGTCPACDIRYENTSPVAPSGKIRSLTKDNAHNLSAIDETNVNVDWTAPLMPAVIFDGNAADIDTTFNLSLIEGNWNAAADTNSGVYEYWYAIGTTSGDSDFVSWTSNGLSQSVSLPATLTAGQWYYFSVRAENNAGLVSGNVQSDGQVAELSTGTGADETGNGLNIFPNPSSGMIYISVAAAGSCTVVITDEAGREVGRFRKDASAGASVLPFDASALNSGIYFVHLYTDSGTSTSRFIRR